MAVFEGLPFDEVSPFQNALAASEVDVGWGEVVQALVIPAVVIVRDELADAGFEFVGQIVIFEQDEIFHRAVPALDLALRHGMVRPAAGVGHAIVLEPVGQLAGDIGWSIIAEQSWSVTDLHSVEPCGFERDLQGGGDIGRGHGGAELPGDDVA